MKLKAMEKKEVQSKILNNEKNNEKTTKEDFLNLLKHVSPGTNLRLAIDGILHAKKGAIVVVENTGIGEILDGGFKINCKFTPQRLIELSKMDGAIILSPDMKRVTHANVTLSPDTKIPTRETGTRHKAAERTARMLATLVITISERRNEVNLYFRNLKYPLRSTSDIIGRANETLQFLEKQRELFDENISQLDNNELNGEANLMQACKVIQKGHAMEKILKSQEKTLIELGNEGAALKLRIRELMKGVEKETALVIKDYTKLNLKKSKGLLSSLNYDELMEPKNILTALAQNEPDNFRAIKGWRVLSKSLLEENEIAEIIREIKNLGDVLNADAGHIKKIIGEERGDLFLKGVEKIRN